MAGLLDALFDPSLYSGQGGLLARLAPSLGAIQPSRGFADLGASFNERFPQQPGFAERFNALPNAAAPEQATPMQIGGYQMPRVGSEAQYAAIPNNATPTQGQLPQAQQSHQQPQALPPAFGRGGDNFLDRVNSGLQSIGAGGSIIGALTGNHTDQKAIAQQNLKAQYDALVPQLGPQKAMLAVLNPEAGKMLLEQALSSKQKFTEIGVNADGTKRYGFVNDRDQTVKPYAMPGSEDSGTVTGPDGKQIPIPPGVDRKTFVNEISRANAKSAAGEKTEVQAKSEKFGNKMELAEKNISQLQSQGTSLAGQIASNVPLGNYVQSNDYQKYQQAKNNFITALLRDESGAAIGTQEFKRYDKELFPQPGDSPEVIAQKAEARRVAIEGMKKAAGPGYKPPADAPSNLPSGWSVKVR